MEQEILIIADFSADVSANELPQLLKKEEWETEANVYHSLQKLGHTVKLFGLSDNIYALVEELRENKPELVFNLCEAFKNDRYFEPHIVSLLELMGIRYTGAGPEALRMCKDKGRTKEILSYHGLNVPKFLVAPKGHPLKALDDFPYPAFIKPLKLEASEGISQVSFAENEKDALERVRFIHERLETDAIIEEYIDGREIYVSILGNERLTVFPFRELFFKEVPQGEPKFATYRAKWNEAYRKKWGIDTGSVRSLPQGVEERVSDFSKKIYRLLGLKGYGRIDLRIKSDGQIYFLEANPNPSLAKDDDFALSAAHSGLDYESLLSKIISLASK